MSRGRGQPAGGQAARGTAPERWHGARGLLLGVAVSWIGPVVVYAVLRPMVANDATALGIASALPILRLAIVWGVRRRVDGFAVFATLGLAVTIALSLWLGASALPIKLVHPAVTGTLGLALIASALLRRPLVLTLLRYLRRGEEVPSEPGRRTATLLTALLGLVLLGDAVVHVALALRVGTMSYLLDSRGVTIGVIVLLIVLRMAFRPRR